MFIFIFFRLINTLKHIYFHLFGLDRQYTIYLFFSTVTLIKCLHHAGQYYTDDQYLNIYSFSLLYKWLHSCAQHVEDTIPKANPEENPEIKDTSKKKTITAKVLQSLVTRSVDYCFRVMDQCERSKFIVVFFQNCKGIPLVSHYQQKIAHFFDQMLNLTPSAFLPSSGKI